MMLSENTCLMPIPTSTADQKVNCACVTAHTEAIPDDSQNWVRMRRYGRPSVEEMLRSALVGQGPAPQCAQQRPANRDDGLATILWSRGGKEPGPGGRVA